MPRFSHFDIPFMQNELFHMNATSDVKKRALVVHDEKSVAASDQGFVQQDMAVEQSAGFATRRCMSYFADYTKCMAGGDSKACEIYNKFLNLHCQPALLKQWKGEGKL